MYNFQNQPNNMVVQKPWMRSGRIYAWFIPALSAEVSVSGTG